MLRNRLDWRLLVGEGLVSFIFSLAISAGGSFVAYSMFASLGESEQGQVLNLTFVEAAPYLALLIYGLFFLGALLALTRLRIRERASVMPRLHWWLAFIFFGLIGLAPGVFYWLLFSAADRPGI